MFYSLKTTQQLKEGSSIMEKLPLVFLSLLAGAANASDCGVLEVEVSGQGAREDFSHFYSLKLDCSESTSVKNTEITRYLSEVVPEQSIKTDEVESGEEMKAFYDDEELVVSFRKTELLGFESHGDEQKTISPLTNKVELEALVLLDNEQSAIVKGDRVEIKVKMISPGAS